MRKSVHRSFRLNILFLSIELKLNIVREKSVSNDEAMIYFGGSFGHNRMSYIENSAKRDVFASAVIAKAGVRYLG